MSSPSQPSQAALVVDNAVVFLYIVSTVNNAILPELKSVIGELIQNLGTLKVNTVIFYANKTRRSICGWNSVGATEAYILISDYILF